VLDQCRQSACLSFVLRRGSKEADVNTVTLARAQRGRGKRRESVSEKKGSEK